MNTGQWELNVESNITVVTSSNVDLIVQYTLENVSVYSQIPGTFTKNGDRYFLPFTFTNTGSYIIRIIDLNNNIKDSYARIIVSEDTVGNSLNTIENGIDTLSTLINALPAIQEIRDEFINIQYGALEIKDSQLTIKDKEDVIIAVFDLFDNYGNPTMTAVYKREVVL
jgi:hypothetical protein